MTSTIDEQIKCVRREIALRKRVYPRFVSAGRMSQKKADEELSAIEAVLDTLSSVKQTIELNRQMSLLAENE